MREKIAAPAAGPLRVLVTGAAGAQGGAVARRLVGLGAEVRAVSRTGNAGPLNLVIETVAADLSDEAAAIAAMTGVSRAWVHFPLIYEAGWTDRFAASVAAAAKSARLERLVLVVGTRIPDKPTAIDAFESRRRAVRRIVEAGVSTVVLHPTLYLENLLMPGVVTHEAEETVLRYPVPSDAPVAWMSHDDLGAYSTEALMRSSVPTHVHMVGARTLTGRDLVARFSQTLGRPVRYESLPVAAFEQGLQAVLSEEGAAGVASTYAWLAAHPDHLQGTNHREFDEVPKTDVDSWIASQHWPATGHAGG